MVSPEDFRIKRKVLKDLKVGLLLSSWGPWQWFCTKPSQEACWNWTKKCSQHVCSVSLLSLWLQLNNNDCWYLWKEKERHSQCGISWGSLGGQSALVYSVQLNKLKCQEHNASSILWKKKKKKTFPFLSLWRCWAAHYSCGYFNTCGNTEKCTHRAPLWPPSLWNKNKINTLLGGDLTKAKDFLPFIFRQVPWQSNRQAWLSTGRNGIGVSQCWCFTWADGYH